MLLKLSITGAIILLFICRYESSCAQEDSIQYLQPVKVRGIALPPTPLTLSHVQIISARDMGKQQAIAVSDLVRHFAGIQLKDYGGLGGLKTVSVRGLGANHTAISYDGIAIHDGQTGQVDLGQYPVNNLESVSFTTGPPEDLLLTASEMAAGSLVRITSRLHASGKSNSLTGGITVGSFGLFSPALVVKNNLNDELSSSFVFNGQTANGRYSFLLENGDSTSREKRENADITQVTLEENLHYSLRDSSKLTLKVNYFQSERGLPGPTIYYNPHSSQRLWDRKFFTQGYYHTSFSEKLTSVFRLKYLSSFQRYLDPDYLGGDGKRENSYRQQEFYFSSSWKYHLTPSITAGIASDLSHGTLTSDQPGFAEPDRTTSLTAFQLLGHRTHWEFQTGAVVTLTSEHNTNGVAASNVMKVTPSAMLSFDPGLPGNLIFRLSYKDIFRLPTFNDLYFAEIGNRELRPEKARLINAGIAWEKIMNNTEYLTVSLDVYHNRVEDKIVALPTKNIYIWSMMNIGTVSVDGMDFTFETTVKAGRNLLFSFETGYSYLSARDVTDPESKSFEDQIAYTPRHSGTVTAGFHCPLFNFYYNLIFSGSRYTLNQNIPANQLEGYAEHGLSIEKKLPWEDFQISLKAECLNILNKQYEVVRNFPMPSRSYRLTILFNM